MKFRKTLKKLLKINMSYPESPIILEAIKQAKKILLHCHVSPDMDSVGSALGMRRALELMGKEVVVIKGDNDLPVGAGVLPGASQIVLKSYSEIDLSEFDLFIIQDSGAIDRITAKEPIVFPAHLKTIVIDHHSSNPGYGQVNLIDVSAPATAFMIYQLLTDWGVKIDHDVAVNLIIGMYFDTGGFRFPYTTPATLIACGELATLAPDYTHYLEQISNSWTAKHLEFVQLALDDLKIIGGGKAIYSTVSSEQMQAKGLTRGDTEMFSINASFLAIKEVKVGFTVFEKEPGVISVSARSKDGEKYDVAKWLQTLGGGGHKQAAGARLVGSLAENLPRVLNSLTEMWPEFRDQN